MSHTFIPPNSPAGYYNVWVLVKWFDDSGVLQEYQADIGQTWDQGATGQMAADATNGWQSDGFFNVPGVTANISKSRIYSVEVTTDNVQYNITPV